MSDQSPFKWRHFESDIILSLLKKSSPSSAAKKEAWHPDL